MLDILKALIIGIIQGLTEFLPVSSSGHIELSKELFQLELNDDLTFSLLLHFATLLSIFIVFRQDIQELLRGLFTPKWNNEKKYVGFLLLSVIPVGLVGLFFKEEIESLFEGRIILVGLMLIVTAILLYVSQYGHQKGRIKGWQAFVIGIAQAIAILPGISRSGATIATGLMLGMERNEATKFSFLMVLLPILGASLIQFNEFSSSQMSVASSEIQIYLAGTIAAFIAGIWACKKMKQIVSQGNLNYFAYYCFTVGIIAIGFGLWNT